MGRVVVKEAEVQSPGRVALLLAVLSALWRELLSCALLRFRLTEQGGAHKVLVECGFSRLLPLFLALCKPQKLESILLISSSNRRAPQHPTLIFAVLEI